MRSRHPPVVTAPSPARPASIGQSSTSPGIPPQPPPGEPPEDGHRLLQIREVAALTGLTSRSIRYYEEMELLRPAARSSGAYRLYDASDVERLRFIRDLRDDAGFSLAEIGRLLEDEDARIRDRARFEAAADTAEKRTILRDVIGRMDRQVARLEEKAARLGVMLTAAEARRDHLRAHLAELEGGAPAHAPGGVPASAPGGVPASATRAGPARDSSVAARDLGR